MQIGLSLPLSGPLASPGIMTRLALEAEAIGYDYMYVMERRFTRAKDRPANERTAPSRQSP